ILPSRGRKPSSGLGLPLPWSKIPMAILSNLSSAVHEDGLPQEPHHHLGPGVAGLVVEATGTQRTLFGVAAVAGGDHVLLRGTARLSPHAHARGVRDRPQRRWRRRSTGRIPEQVRCSASNAWNLSRANMSRGWTPLVPLITRVMESRTAVDRDAMFLP